MATNPEVDRLSEVTAQLVGHRQRATNMVKAHRGKLAAIDGQWDLPDKNKSEGKKLQWQQFESAVSRFNSERATLERERTQLLSKLTAGHRQPGGAQEEMLRQAAWNRLEKNLDSTPAGQLRFVAATNLLEAAANTGDMATLEAARRELPAYLERHRERLPKETAVWLDMNGGPPETVAARVQETCDADSYMASAIAANWMNRAVRSREVPDIMPGNPHDPPGKRVVWLNGDE